MLAYDHYLYISTNLTITKYVFMATQTDILGGNKTKFSSSKYGIYYHIIT